MADHPGRETEADLLTDGPLPAAAPSVPAPASAQAGSPASAAPLLELAARLQSLAIERGVSVGSAESCTGGLVGHAITEMGGSSAYYLGGVVSYADAVKEELLGVPGSTLDQHGAVSAQVAVAMADGIRSLVKAAYAVAVTGIAGPDGGSEAKPVGLTYVAAAGPHGHEVRRYTWSGDRASNKLESARASLQLLLEVIESDRVVDETPA